MNQREAKKAVLANLAELMSNTYGVTWVMDIAGLPEGMSYGEALEHPDYLRVEQAVSNIEQELRRRAGE